MPHRVKIWSCKILLLKCAPQTVWSVIAACFNADLTQKCQCSVTHDVVQSIPNTLLCSHLLTVVAILSPLCREQAPQAKGNELGIQKVNM